MPNESNFSVYPFVQYLNEWNDDLVWHEKCHGITQLQQQKAKLKKRQTQTTTHMYDVLNMV